MKPFKKLSSLLAIALLIGTNCDSDYQMYVDEWALVSSKWRLDDSSVGCIEGPGRLPSDAVMIFRPDGEFIVRGFGQEVFGSWSISQGTIRIMDASYQLRDYIGDKLVLENKDCIGTYVAVGLDEIYQQGASSVSQHGTVLKGLIETNHSEDLKIVVEYGYTHFLEESIEIVDNVTSAGYPPIEVSGELTGLAPGTRYHYRLKAVNETSGYEFYGPMMTFQTFNEVQVEDVDGNVYNTVTIDNRVWMAENLRVTHLRDGTPIPSVSNETAVWRTVSEPAMAFSPIEPCGGFYNGYAATTGQLCPEGWHIPTSQEWRHMINFLGSKPKT